MTETPVTHRGVSSAVALITGHEDPDKSGPGLDWSALARFPGTLAVYMGMARLGRTVQALLSHGLPPETPAAVVASAGTGAQRRVRTTLAELPAAVGHAGLRAPALVLIGPAAGHGPAEAWFERRPLFGRRVVVTRPRDQAGELVRRLELLGAVPVVQPAVEIRPPDDWSAVDARLARLSDYDWLVFTSANGVQAFFARLRQTGRDLRALGRLKLAAIGPGTAEALRAFHLDADLVPDEYRSEALAAALAGRAAGSRVLLARADRGRDVLPDELAKVADVEQVACYRQVDVPIEAALIGALRRGEENYVTLTSANIARAFLRPLDDSCRDRIRSGDVRLVTISPVTTAAVKEFGLPVAAEATTYTVDGLVYALVRDAAARGRSEQVAKGVPGQVGQDQPGDDADDVNRQEGRATAERDAGDQVNQEQEGEQGGNGQ
jgi:uroporphyrinogen III methyltransferase/synthase